MRTARDRALALRDPTAIGLAGGVLVLLVAAAFAGEAFVVAAASLAVGGALGTAALLGRIRLARGAGLFVGALVALAAWNGLSAAWSVAPDRSWDELNLVLVYTAFSVLGALLGSSGTRALRLTAIVLAAALGATVLWALAGKAIPALFPDGARAARLRDPIGYWNALALAADALLVLGLWLAAAAGRSRGLRVGGVLLGYAAVVAVLLATSRAGVAGALVAVLAWLALSGGRVERALLALIAVVPGVAVAAWTFTRPGLVDDGIALADRAAAGRLFALALLAGGALAAAAALCLDRLDLRGRRRQLVGRALAAGLVGVLLAAAAGVAAAGDPLSSGRSVAQGPARLADAGLNNRRQFWAEAVRLVQAEPLTGTGAGTFEVARRKVREDATSAVEPHSVPLQILSGTGPVGLLLFGVVVAAVVLAGVGALRRAGREERRAAVALVAVCAAYGVHALVDYDWSFLAVTAPTLVAAGALATAGRAERVAPTPWAAAGAVVLTVAAIVSVALPWLAERAVEEAGTHLASGDAAAAMAAAERAHSLDPLSIAPLQTLAAVHASRRHVRAAREAYAAAVRLQPENAETWYELGLYEFDRRLLCQAYRHLNEAYTLDPRSTRWVPGGPLDVARDWVNAGRCG